MLPKAIHYKASRCGAWRQWKKGSNQSTTQFLCNKLNILLKQRIEPKIFNKKSFVVSTIFASGVTSFLPSGSNDLQPTINQTVNYLQQLFEYVSSNPSRAIGQMLGRGGDSPTVTAREVLIAANIGVFLAWRLAQRFGGIGFLLRHFTASPENIRNGRLHSLLLGGFSHISLTHLFLNCFALNVLLSPNCLGELSSNHIYGIFCLSAISCSLGQILFSNQSVIGASGAVMAYSVVESFLNPEQRFMLLFPLPGVTVTSVQVTQLLFLVNVFMTIKNKYSRGVATVAWFGHLVGMGAGALYVSYARLVEKNRRMSQPQPKLSYVWTEWRDSLADFSTSVKMFRLRQRIKNARDIQKFQELNDQLDILKYKREDIDKLRRERRREREQGGY